MNKRRKRKQLKRMAASVFAALIITVVCFASCGGSKQEVKQEEERQRIEWTGVEEYEVGAFDTLSGISVRYIPSDDYMQQWVEDVMELNGRKNSTIYFGEVIKVFTFEG